MEVESPGKWLGKDLGGTKVTLGVEQFALLLNTLKAGNSPNLFRGWTVLLAREAAGLRMAKKLRQFKEEQAKLRKFYEESDAKLNNDAQMRKFLGEEGGDEASEKLAARTAAVEVFESFEEYKALQYVIEKGLYVPGQARKDFASASAGNKNLHQVLDGFNVHFDELMLTEGDLTQLTAWQLQLFMTMGILDRIQDVGSLNYAFYAFSEVKRFDLTGKGLTGQIILSI